MEEIEKISLVNKLVRVSNTSEGIDNSGIIPFMYPSFKMREEIFFDHGNDVIYTGKYHQNIRKELENGTKSFIAMCSYGMYDVDFTNRDTIIKVLYSKWDKTPSEDTKNMLDNMSNNDFWDFFKKFWVTGRSKFDKGGKSLLDLHKVLGKQRYEILKIYLELKEVYPDSVIFSSVLGFLEKALNPEMVSSKSGIYMNLLKEFGESYSSGLVSIIQKAYMLKGSTKSDKEYRTLWLLMQLGKGNMI